MRGDRYDGIASMVKESKARGGGETGSTKMGGRGVLESKPRSVASTRLPRGLVARVWPTRRPRGYSADGPESGRHGVRRRVPSLILLGPSSIILGDRSLPDNGSSEHSRTIARYVAGGRSTVRSPHSRSQAENDDGGTWQGRRIFRLY